jgi:hypothetical protein
MKTPPIKNGKKTAAKQAVHAHERALHPGAPLTRINNNNKRPGASEGRRAVKRTTH